MEHDCADNFHSNLKGNQIFAKRSHVLETVAGGRASHTIRPNLIRAIESQAGLNTQFKASL